MLFAFLAASFVGQARVQFCTCSGMISMVSAEDCVECHGDTGECQKHDACGLGSDCEQNLPADDRPCSNDDCLVVLWGYGFESLANLGLRNVDAPEAPAPANYRPLESLEAPKVIGLAPILRPPDPPGVPLNVLYASFLI